MAARQREAERLAPGVAPLVRCSSDANARRFADKVLGTSSEDPLLLRVRRLVDRDTTVLDVGSGPGRLALPLAGEARQVLAIDQDAAMLRILQREAGRAGVENVACLLGRWQDVDAPEADIVLSAYVLHSIEDAGPFLAKIDSSMRRQAFVCLGAISPDTWMEPLWQYLHGAPRRPLPSYLDAVDVIRELGIHPRVELVEVPSLLRFADVEEAISECAELLLMPSTAEARSTLGHLLSSWLVRREGAWWPPLATSPAAILSWGPGERSSRRSAR